MGPSLALQLPEIGHGQHCCLLFDSPEEQSEVTVPFLMLGLERGEQTVYVGDPASVECLREGLKSAGVPLEREEAAGRLALSSARDYLDRGRFSPDKMLAFLQQAYDAALASGATALRAAGNVAWQVGPERDFRDVVYYEALLDTFFLGKRMVGICQYPRRDCPPEVLSGVLNTHRVAGIGRDFCDNVHYLPPGLLTEKDAAAREALRAEWMSSQLLRIRRAEEERDRLRSQLAQSQKLEAIGRLAGGVAHDFNNLLTVILGYNSLLLEDAGGGSRPALERIRDAGERAQGLTRQLLAVGRRQALEPRGLDLNEALLASEALLRDLAGPQVDLSIRRQPGLWRMRADPVQLEQVLSNLVVNARDAMPGGGQLTIETANVTLDEAYARAHVGASAGPHVMLAVTDTGQGMDAETCERIFEPFFTTKAAGKGTGLGLATVLGVVKSSGGNIWLYSEPGRGSAFKLYFPRDEAPDAALPEAPAPAAPAARRGVVLVADDQPALRSLIQDVLAGAGHQVLCAADAEEALRLSRGHPGHIDVLVADLVLPGMDGGALAAEARLQRPDLKVLLMSGYPDEAVRRRGKLPPNSLFLGKPFPPSQLLKAIQGLL